MELRLSHELRDFVDDVFSEESICRRGLFSASGLRDLFSLYQNGAYPYEVIWQFVILELWLRKVFDRASEYSQGRPSLIPV